MRTRLEEHQVCCTPFHELIIICTEKAVHLHLRVCHLAARGPLSLAVVEALLIHLSEAVHLADS